MPGRAPEGTADSRTSLLVSRGCATAHAVCGCIVGSPPGVLYASKNIFAGRNEHPGKATKLADMTTHFDAIVIGTGQAGPALAARLAGAGQKVAVIERDKFGGTCVNDGCTPTKTMVASAYAARLAARSAQYGVVMGGKA